MQTLPCIRAPQHISFILHEFLTKNVCRIPIVGKAMWCTEDRIWYERHAFMAVCVWQSHSHVQLFETPRTGSCQVPLSMEFSRWEYWSGLPFPSPGDLPDPGIKPGCSGFPGVSDSKESACNAGDLDLIPGLGRSLGEGNGYPFQQTCLENEEPDRL